MFLVTNEAEVCRALLVNKKRRFLKKSRQQQLSKVNWNASNSKCPRQELTRTEK